MSNFPEKITVEQGPALFVKGGLAPLLEIIKVQALSEVPNVSTAKGRERIASLAYRVSQCKTTVEKPGRAYLKYLKDTLIKEAETEIRDFVRACDDLRDAVRQPLTDIENREKARIQGHRDSISLIEETGAFPYTLRAAARDALALTELWPLDDLCEEFLPAYQLAVENARAAIQATLARIDQAEALAVEQAARREQEAAERAVASERLRVAQAAEAEAQRTANTMHRDGVKSAVLLTLTDCYDIDEQTAARLISDIAEGLVKSLKIIF